MKEYRQQKVEIQRKLKPPRARLHGQPVHPKFIAFPHGLLIFGYICHVVYIWSGADLWQTASLYAVAGGLAGSVFALITGFMEYVHISNARTYRYARTHGVLNVAAFVLFGVSFGLRAGNIYWPAPFILSTAGLITLLVGGWMGGTLIYIYGLGVSEQGARRAIAEEKAYRRENRLPPYQGQERREREKVGSQK